MYRLQSLRPLHDLTDARKRYDDALALLLRVARGEVTLGLTADNLEPPQSPGSVVNEIAGGLPPDGPPFFRSRIAQGVLSASRHWIHFGPEALSHLRLLSISLLSKLLSSLNSRPS